MNSIQDRYI